MDKLGKAYYAITEVQPFIAQALRMIYFSYFHTTVKPVLNGISRYQNIFPLKPGFHLIKVHYI
jgi:hypothetical protein